MRNYFTVHERSMCLNLVFHEIGDLPQIIQQLFFLLDGLVPAWVESCSPAVALQRGPIHLLVLEQGGSVEVKVWATSG